MSYPQVIHNANLAVCIVIEDRLDYSLGCVGCDGNPLPLKGRKMEIITCNVTEKMARAYGRKSFAMAIGRACKDIGVYVVGRHGARRAMVHGAPVALNMEAQRALGALENGIVSDYTFTVSLPEIVETWSRVFGASFDDVNDIGD